MREVPTEEARNFAEHMGSLFAEASSKTGAGVQDAFSTVIEQILATVDFQESGFDRDRPYTGNIYLREVGNVDGSSRTRNADSGAKSGRSCWC